MRSKANFLNYLITGKKYLKINIIMLRLFILVTNLQHLNLRLNTAIFSCFVLNILGYGRNCKKFDRSSKCLFLCAEVDFETDNNK